MTSPGGKDTMSLNALWVPIMPETSQLGSGVEKAGKDAKAKFENATKGMGETMNKGVDTAAKEQARLLDQAAAAQQRYEKSVRAVDDASGKVRTTQLKLSEVMNNSKASTSQIATATENYTRAQRNHTAALSESQRATQTYHSMQQQLNSTVKTGGDNAEEAGGKHRAMMAGMGLAAGAMAGAVAEGVNLVAEGAQEAFTKMIELGKEVVTHLMEIGEAWEGVEHSIELHSAGSAQHMEELNRAAVQIAASGAPVKLDMLGTTLATLDTRIKGLSLDQLKTLATHVQELGERTGEPINMLKLTSALNLFQVPAAGADKALEGLVNTARGASLPINTIIEGVAKAGPAASALGLSIGQVGGFMAVLSGIGDPARSIMALSTAAAHFAKDKIPLNEGLAETIKRTQDFLKLGTDQGNTQAFKQITDVFGARGGAAIFAGIQQGSIDLDSLAHSADAGGESLDALLDHTQTLGTRFEGFQNQVTAALKPLGMSLLGGMTDGIDRASEYLQSHTPQIINALAMMADGAIDMASSFLGGFGAITEAAGGLVGIIGKVESVQLRLQATAADFRGDHEQANELRKQADDAWAWGDSLKTLGANMQDLSNSGLPQLKAGIEKLRLEASTAATFTQALGKAVISVPDEKHLTIDHNTPEVVDALAKLHLDVENLPDGTQHITAETQDAKDQFEKYIEDTTGKKYDVELKAKPETPEGAPVSTNPQDDLKKMFGIDANNPVPFPVFPQQTDATGTPTPPGTNPLLSPYTAGAPGAVPGGLPGAPAGTGGGNPLNVFAPTGGVGGGMGPGGRPMPGRGMGGPGLAAAVDQRLSAQGLNMGGGAEAWRNTVRSVVSSVGPAYGVTNVDAWTDALVRQIDSESHGDPTAYNGHDSNGRGGTQQVSGILQFLASTYASNNITGLPFPDPIGEIAAAIPYVLGRYGQDANGVPQHIGHGIGFATGMLPGIEGGGGSGGSTPHTVSDLAGASPASIDAWVAQAIRLTGVDPAVWTQRMKTIISRESAGDPMAINLTDINAQHGDPSKGLAQVIGSTFGLYHAPGTSQDIWDPVANIAASIRYQQARYGPAGPDQGDPNRPSHGYAMGSGALRKIMGAGSGQSDSIMAMLGGNQPIYVSNGESINTYKSTVENAPWLDAMNRGLRLPPFPHSKIRGYAGGGVPGGATDNSDTADPRHGGSIPGVASGVGQDIVDFMSQLVEQYNQTNGTQLQITAGRASDGSHDDDGGQHSVNRAVDIGGPAAQRAAFVQWWESDPGRSAVTRQLIASGLGMDVNQYEIIGGSVGNYHGEAMSNIYSKDNPQHGDHIHLALQAIPGSTGDSGANMSLGYTTAPTAGAGLGGAGTPGASNGGYVQSQYPGYMVNAAGDYKPVGDVPGAGNYGGATPNEVAAANKRVADAQRQAQSTRDSVATAQKALDDLQNGKPTADGLGVTPATQEQLDAATKRLADARASQAAADQSVADATDQYGLTINKPPEKSTTTTGKTGAVDKNAETLGGGLVTGALQSLGFDGSVFGDPTQWGIWKLFTGGVNYAAGLAKNMDPNKAAAMGLPFGGGEGGGGSGLLSGLFSGLTSSVGLPSPAATSGAVPLAASSAATVSTGVIPGNGMPVGSPASGTGAGSPPGPVTYAPQNNFHGITDTAGLASTLTGQQAAQSRALNVGPPVGGLPQPTTG